MGDAARRQGWRWPRLTARGAAAMLAVFAGVALANGFAVWLARLDEPRPAALLRALVWEGTSAFAFWVGLPIVLTAVVNAPLGRTRWPRTILLHLAGYALTTAVHVAVMIGLRGALYAAAGWGRYDAGPPAVWIPMEMLRDLVSYVMLATIFTLLQSWRDRQRDVLQAAQLEAELRVSQLRNLSANLHPHFLFNALNTISAVMYEDLARTDRLIADLGELLRESLEDAGPTWALRHERAYVERYVSVLQARFGPRLAVGWRIPAELERLPVPRFAVQTLVENAVKHNADLGAPLRIEVTAALDGDRRWRVEVIDSGRGFAAAGPERNGIGLSQLRHRLALLHGDAAAVVTENGPDGGARVLVRLPREAP